jgi:hypothetical protein
VVSEQTPSDDATPERGGLLGYLDSEKTDRAGAAPRIHKDARYDQRWVCIHRPLIVGGGELALKELDLVFDPITKYYEAPHQMKANGGVFLVDDLGRQRVSPRGILNRWIVPLEKRVDYLTLRTGHKIDEAFLRRLRYKIHLADPTWQEFREIFMREAAKRTILYTEEGLRYIVMEYYTKPKRRPRGVHPRDILDGLVEIAAFRGVPPTLSKELIDRACQVYFLEGSGD